MIGKSGNISIGEECFFNNGCSISALENVIIGNGCLFGENVCIYDHNHRFNERKPLKEQGYAVGSVIIGDDCWIGSNVVILKGVKIGNRVVVGAGCIISEDIPDDTVIKQDRKFLYEKIRYKE